MGNRRARGFALMLVSLLLLVAFENLGWKHFFDFRLTWQHIWLATGIVGFVMAWRNEAG